jgi:hypothetical protein
MKYRIIESTDVVGAPCFKVQKQFVSFWSRKPYWDVPKRNDLRRETSTPSGRLGYKCRAFYDLDELRGIIHGSLLPEAKVIEEINI